MFGSCPALESKSPLRQNGLLREKFVVRDQALRPHPNQFLNLFVQTRQLGFHARLFCLYECLSFFGKLNHDVRKFRDQFGPGRDTFKKSLELFMYRLDRKALSRNVHWRQPQ